MAIFAPLGGAETDALETTRDLLERGISESPYIALIERETVDRILRESDYGSRTAVSDEEAALLGRRMGAEAALLPVVRFVSGQYYIALRIIDVGSGETELSGAAWSSNFFTALTDALTELFAPARESGGDTTAAALPAFTFMGRTLYVAPEDLPGTYTHEEAVAAARRMNADNGYGYSGWRLPTRQELQVMYQQRNRLGGFFDDIGGGYWSSSEGRYNNYAWWVNFYGGNAYDSPKDDDHRVRLIREE